MTTGVTRYGEGQLLAVPALHKDKRQISIEFSIQLLKDLDGQIEWVVAIVRDVTDRFHPRKGPARPVEGRSQAVNRVALRANVMLAHVSCESVVHEAAQFNAAPIVGSSRPRLVFAFCSSLVR